MEKEWKGGKKNNVIGGEEGVMKLRWKHHSVDY